jgi:hypothetical protein
MDEDDAPIVIARWAGPRRGALPYVINNGSTKGLMPVRRSVSESVR